MNRCAHCFGDLPDFAVFCPHCARAYEPDFALLMQKSAGQPIGGRYCLYRRLGQGGLSTVFAATDLRTDNVVVVKISDPAQLVQRELSYAIDADAARNYWWEMLERMRHEAETLAGIDHPNIVRFFDTGLIGDDLRFVVMEFLRGRMLREDLNAKGRIEPAEAIRITLDVCEALREVHARGIVHRDISPRNIFIADCGLRIAEDEQVLPLRSTRTSAVSEEPQSVIKLIDFGIAKFPQPPGAPPFTQHSVLSGTVAYASPEQCQSREVDHRSDIYSLGVVLYEMVTGQRPFTGRTPTEVALKQIQSEPVPPRQVNPDLPAGLEQVILRTLAKDPDDRQQTVEELMGELRAGAHQVVIPLQMFQPGAEAIEDGAAGVALADDEASVDRLTLIRRRRRRVALAAAAVVLVAAAAGLLFGKNWLASRFAGVSTSDSAALVPTPSPSPGESTESSASDPDSLELAAQLPADSVGRTSTVKSAAQAAASGAAKMTAANPPASGAAKAPASSNVPTAASSKASAKPTPAPQPPSKSAMPQKATQVAVKTQPAATPEPSPTMAAHPPQVSPPPTNNKTEVAQVPPRPETSREARQEPVQPRTAPRDAANDQPQTSHRDRIATNRSREDNRYPASRRNDPNDDAGDDDPTRADAQQMGPKLIQWSGSVNREREITIDLPGVPGTLEIPRVYRNRVGVVEPPSHSNRWRCAKLRVFGQGGVSFVVRWWPTVRSFVSLRGQK